MCVCVRCYLLFVLNVYVCVCFSSMFKLFSHIVLTSCISTCFYIQFTTHLDHQFRSVCWLCNVFAIKRRQFGFRATTIVLFFGNQHARRRWCRDGLAGGYNGRVKLAGNRPFSVVPSLKPISQPSSCELINRLLDLLFSKFLKKGI